MVAPTIESITLPPTPPATAETTASAGQRAIHTIAAVKAAAPADARNPSAVTPPDVPVATGRPVRIERGVDGDSTPISGAHVPAADADRAAAATSRHTPFPD